MIPDSDILLATAWQTADFSISWPPSRGEKFYFVQHHESLWKREKSKAHKTYCLPFRKLVISIWLKEILKEQYQQDADVLVTPVNQDTFFKEEKKGDAGSRVCLLHHDYDWKGYKDAIETVKIVRSQNY